ncbi:MAG: DUF4375 domain-containing protein, partial [Planctomycetia bacterium]|nr:DUF4375 domain-containing protein [Planctomycetia bacterium]
MKLPRHTIWWVLVAIVVGAIVVARLRSAIFPPELVGVWKVERTQINGLWHGRDHELGGNRELWVIRSGQLTIVRGDGPEELKLKVDSSQIPGHFDTGQPPPVRGIYQLLGDDLRVCQSLPIIPRPTDFQNELGVFQNVTVLHRVSTDATPPADGNWRPLMARIFGPEKPAPSQKTFDAEAEAYVQRVMLQIGEEGPWTESQRVVWNVAELISEVENGGFHQFLYNSSGDNAAETATQLRLIGAPKT